MIELLYELWEYLFEESRGTFDFLVPPNEAMTDPLLPQVFSLSELPMCDKHAISSNRKIPFLSVPPAFAYFESAP